MSYYSQPGIFNVLDDWGSLGSGMIPGDSTLLTAIHNAKALQATIDAAVASCPSDSGDFGAIVLIPSNSLVPPPVGPGTSPGPGGEYFIAAASALAPQAVTITCPFPLLILGTGTETILHMLDGKPLFRIDNSGSDDQDIGGIAFQDLQFVYDSTVSSGAAIYAAGAGFQNVRIFRCVFTDVPQGVLIQNTLQFSMLECTSVYESRTSGTMLSVTDEGTVMTGSNQAYIADCSFIVNSEGANTAVGLFVGIANELRFVDSSFDGLQTAIKISPSEAAQDMTFENVVAAGPGTQLLVVPPASTPVQNLAFINCSFTNDDPSSTLSAVILDADGNADIDTVRFVSCTCLLNPASGLEIKAGRNIEILGGSYSGNAQGSAHTGAGIWINGTSTLAPTDVCIRGVACTAVAFASSAQQYGIIVGSGASNIYVSNCDLTGYGSTGPIQFLSAGTNNIQVLKCPGYNDQGTPISMAAPSSLAEFNGTYFTAPYFGPVTFYVSGSGIQFIWIQDKLTNLTSGTFRVAAGSTAMAKIQYNTSPTFLMIGE